MNRSYVAIILAALIILPVALTGCKGKPQEMPEEMAQESADSQGMTENQVTEATEPSQIITTETIPPTAAPQMNEKPASPVTELTDRNKQIQIALRNAGFYTGAIDGKVGPKTKKAIEEFQRAAGLKVDGKVGPKTWAELAKHLTQ